MAVIICLERWHTYLEPLERDITTYAVIGHELLSGRKLYSDLWDCKPPVLYFSFSMAEVLAGYGPSEIYLLNILTGLLTLWGVYRAGCRIGGRAGGLWASLFWSVLSGDLYLQANQPNIEVFLNACLTWAFVFWLGVGEKKFDARKGAAVGFLLALASLYKHVFIFSDILMGLLYLGLQWKNHLARRAAYSMVLWIFGFLSATWVLLVGYFALTQRIKDFIGAIVIYNFFNNHFGVGRVSIFLEFFQHNQTGMEFPIFILPLLLLSLGGILFRDEKNIQPWLLWLVFLISSEAALFAPGLFLPHYYQLLLPWLVIGGGWSSARLGQVLSGRWKKTSLLPGILVLLILIFHEAPFYQWPAVTWSEKKYGDVFTQTVDLAKRVDQILEPGETFYEWGNETGLYFLTKRSPPCGLFYGFPLMISNLTDTLSLKTIEQLGKNKPELFIFYTGYLPEGWGRNPLMVWLREHYRLLPGEKKGGKFLFLMRKGGRLEKRLSDKI